MSFLFEYGNWEATQKKDELKHFLRNIWQQRVIDESYETENTEGIDNRYQPFLEFDDDRIRANNYVGFIQNDDEIIEIYPKVFRNVQNPDKNLMLRHIFYWFTYCRKWRFPFNQATLDSNEIDKFPELIIHLIANQFLETVSRHPLMQYHSIEEALTTPRGSINFNRYINGSLSKGNYHHLECDYEPFLFDNKVNRIIKYCCRLLLAQSHLVENQRLLQETLFVLDEVDDVQCSINDVNSVSLNSFYEDYALLMGMSKTIIDQQIYSNRSYDISQWCLLFPMEYIFEDFVAGFLERHFSDKWKVEYQKSDEYLSDEPRAFNMQHDIFLTERKTGRKIIVDTKYKLRPIDFKNDPKKGIAQADLYQVITYAYKRGCTEVFLIYPNISEAILDRDEFLVKPATSSTHSVQVTAFEIPFWSLEYFPILENRLRSQFDLILEKSNYE